MKTKAYLYIVASAVFWGLIGLFVRTLAAQGFTSMQIVSIRAVVSALLMVLVLLKMGTQYFKIELKTIWPLVGMGIVSLTFSNFCYFNCIELSSLAVAALLLYTAPIFVMLMSLVLFGESFTIPKAIALGATFLGCAFVTGAFDSDVSLSLAGLLFGLGSGIGYALYSIFGKYAIRSYSTLTITTYAFFFASISSIPLANFTSDLKYFDFTTLWAALGLAALSTVIPYLLYTWGLEEVEAGRASILATVEPLVAAAVGIAIFSEPITLHKLIGTALICSSIIVLNMPKKRA
ncbi:MAG: EamA family transporter [Phascolarctobacterium sp.]|nr:EamA family transporter [Phascolarctobacterium sp.]